jgi:hypothetical protein
VYLDDLRACQGLAYQTAVGVVRREMNTFHAGHVMCQEFEDFFCGFVRELGLAFCRENTAKRGKLYSHKLFVFTNDAQVDAYNTIILTLLDHLQALCAILRTFPGRWSTDPSVFQHLAVDRHHCSADATPPIGDIRWRCIAVSPSFQGLKRLDGRLCFGLADSACCLQTRSHFNHRSTPELVLLVGVGIRPSGFPLPAQRGGQQLEASPG